MIGTHNPGSVLVDHAKNLLLVDATKSEMRIYAPPYNDRPAAKIGLKGSETFCAFGRREEHLYCLDYKSASVDVYSYQRRSYLYSFNNGIDISAEPIGITVRPTER